MAMGARSQSARTYLEKHLTEFPECDKDELIRHGLRALSDTLPNEVELTVKVIAQTRCFYHKKVLSCLKIGFNLLLIYFSECVNWLGW